MVMRYVSGNRGRDTKEWTLKKLRAYAPAVVHSGIADPTVSHYEGDVVDGKAHGTGVAIYHDGSRYGGGWNQGLRQGTGVMDTTSSGSYDGEWNRNVYDGQGKRTYSDGSYYIGEWLLGSRHGTGTLSAKEFKYEGPWVNDKPHGTHAKFFSSSSIRMVPTPSSSSSDPSFPIEFFLERVGSGIKSYEGFVSSEHGRQGKGKTEYRNGMVYNGEYHLNMRQGKGRCTYENGDRYDGDWNKDQRHGNGLLLYAAGGRYEGEWKADQKHGTGVQEYHKGDKYVGGWSGDLISGQGVMTYKNGDVYEGSWQNGVRHGMGHLKFFKKKAEYTGPMANGLLHTGEGTGYGRMLHGNGDLFIGSFVKGERTRGIMWCSNGNTYSGSWRHDKFHGKGVMWDKDGGFYYGNWSKGMENGLGCKRYADKAEYIGEWVDGDRSGSGLLQRGNTTIVHGTWAADAPSAPYYDGAWMKRMYHGPGAYHYPNGSVYSGIWLEGTKATMGRILFKDGAKYFGGMSHDLPHGSGILEYPNGSVYSGSWSYGTRQGAGILFDKDNSQVFNGIWVNDERVGSGVLYIGDSAVLEGTWDASGRLEGTALLHFMHEGAVRRVVQCAYTEGVEKTEIFPKLTDHMGLTYAGTAEGSTCSNASIAACTGCSQGFTMTRWKYTCPGCHKPYCSNCMRETRSPAGFSRFDAELVPSSEKQMENKTCVQCTEAAQQGVTVITAWEEGTCITGTVRSQFFTGQAVKHYPNGDVYVGEMVRDVEEGLGNSIRHSDGEEYFGQWREGVRSGYGYLLQTDGTVKEGVFESNLLLQLRYHGEVERQMVHGITTEVRPHGRGVANYENGDEYNGQHVSGLRQGIGYMQYANNDTYIGEWRAGKKCGRGRLAYADGDIYTGLWKDDLQHGKGTLKRRVKTGEGESTFEVQEGEWREGKLCDVVLVRTPQGDVTAQMWCDGEEKRDVFSLPESIPDSASAVCMNTACGKQFTFLRRRHHCRGCGGLFCSDCSSCQHAFPRHFDYSSSSSRCCEACKRVYTAGRAARLFFSADQKKISAILSPGLVATKHLDGGSFSIQNDDNGFGEVSRDRTKDMSEEAFCDMFNRLCTIGSSLLSFPSEVLANAAAMQWDPEAIIGDIVTEHVPFVPGSSRGAEYVRPTAPERSKAPKNPPPAPSFPVIPAEEDFDEIVEKEGGRLGLEDAGRIPLTLDPVPAPPREEHVALEWSSWTPDKDLVKEVRHRLAAGANLIAADVKRKELPTGSPTAGGGPAGGKKGVEKEGSGSVLLSGLQVMAKPITFASSAVTTAVAAPVNAITNMTRGGAQALTLAQLSSLDPSPLPLNHSSEAPKLGRPQTMFAGEDAHSSPAQLGGARQEDVQEAREAQPATTSGDEGGCAAAGGGHVDPAPTGGEEGTDAAPEATADTPAEAEAEVGVDSQGALPQSGSASPAPEATAESAEACNAAPAEEEEVPQPDSQGQAEAPPSSDIPADAGDAK